MAGKRDVRVVVSFTLKPTARRLLDGIARQQGRSRSQVVEHLILAAGQEDSSTEPVDQPRSADQDRLLIDYELRELKDPTAWERVNEAFDRYVAACKKKGRPASDIGAFIAQWEAMQQRDEHARLVESIRDMSGLPPRGAIGGRGRPQPEAAVRPVEAISQHEPGTPEVRG